MSPTSLANLPRSQPMTLLKSPSLGQHPLSTEDRMSLAIESTWTVLTLGPRLSSRPLTSRLQIWSLDKSMNLKSQQSMRSAKVLCQSEEQWLQLQCPTHQLSQQSSPRVTLTFNLLGLPLITEVLPSEATKYTKTGFSRHPISLQALINFHWSSQTRFLQVYNTRSWLWRSMMSVIVSHPTLRSLWPHLCPTHLFL